MPATVTEELLVLPEGHELVGANCIACGKKVQPGDEIVICPRCKAVHHADCWREALGCSRRGCPQVAQAVRPEKIEKQGDDRYLKKKDPKRTALTIAAIVVVLAGLVISMRPGPDPAAGRTKIELMVPGGILESEYYEPFVEQFNTSQDELYISLMVTPFTAYEQKLVVLLGARDAPDIFSIRLDRYQMYAEHGGLLNLSSYLQSDSQLLQKYFPEGTDKWQVNGSIYGIPHPYRNEVFVIWHQSPHPDIAWKMLQMVLDKIRSDWPEQLKGELPEGRGSGFMLPGMF